MAPTFRHGKEAYFAMSDTAGSTFNCSSGLDDSSLERSVDTAEVTAYGDDDKVYLAGLRDATVPVSGHFASTYDAKLQTMLAHSTGTTWTYGPAGNSTGLRKFRGNGIITSMTVGSPVGDKVSASWTLQVSGPITSTTF